MLEGVKVFLERKTRRQYVGLLTQQNTGFVFEYDRAYLKARDIISLGPEMPLTRRIYHSDTLFIPFLDRIPSRENPAYSEYCRSMDISFEETNPLILLSTIAHRGPSSFIFEPLYGEEFSAEKLLAFRKRLKLTVRDFAACFDFSPSAITRIERGQASGREVLKRAEIYAKFPQTALFQLKRRGGALHINKYQYVAKELSN
ncbi:MAG: HipA N-terminal domain-containing protein [Myxococcaceae bacterium]